MFSLNMPLLLSPVFLYVLAFFVLHTATHATDYQVFRSCTTSSFTPNSTYQLNLKSLLSSLLAKSNSSSTAGFYNTTTTSGSRRTPDTTVYGLFMCRGDVLPELCQKCVTSATKQLISDCKLKKEALIWYNECLVRYSDRVFFSIMDEMPGNRSRKRDDYSGDDNQFDSIRRSLMDDIIIQAANSPMGSKKFAVKEAKIPGEDDKIYGLAQCTPDLSGDNCSRCLKDASKEFDTCCGGKIGARVVYPSCCVRYEVYAFYKTAGRLPGKSKIRTITIIMIVVGVFATLAICAFGCYCLPKRAPKKSSKDILKDNLGDDISKDLESLQFDFGTIEAATGNFSSENMIGKGGFGAVYKGVLADGQEIAVKRLSEVSSQGVNEFKNEVLLIARLQHKNLVKLIGFCLEMQEKILVYEYVSNKSLDHFLFDTHKQRVLTWQERYRIIRGIARGMLYLHEDSRLKIIHRDLKPSNVLLDGNMNPKIADFGMARMVAVDQIEESTCRIVGTFGYMTPEYVLHGLFSVKSDVFSFGVMILEIISGKRNASAHQSHSGDDLLSYAWFRWKDEIAFQLLDSALEGCYSEKEASRCIQIGLLCVQENPDDRPTMATVNLILNSDSLDLPLPREPAYFTGNRTAPNISHDLTQSTSYSVRTSTNEISESKFSPR